MRKTLTFLLLLVLTAGSLSADNYLAFGNSDTIRIPPHILGDNWNNSIRAQFDGRLDTWYMSMFLPSGLSVVVLQRGSDMTVHYLNADSLPASYAAPLSTYSVQNGYGLASQILIPGYWDYNFDGVMESYGTVKWEAGNYSDMLSITLAVDTSFRRGAITVTGSLFTSNDTRGGTINSPTTYSKSTLVYVGYRRGDVNGDDLLSIEDATMINDYLLSGDGFDEFQLEAADFNGDGMISVLDVSALMTILLS